MSSSVKAKVCCGLDVDHTHDACPDPQGNGNLRFCVQQKRVGYIKWFLRAMSLMSTDAPLIGYLSNR
jgi:hypothetical protein